MPACRAGRQSQRPPPAPRATVPHCARARFLFSRSRRDSLHRPAPRVSSRSPPLFVKAAAVGRQPDTARALVLAPPARSRRGSRQRAARAPVRLGATRAAAVKKRWLAASAGSRELPACPCRTCELFIPCHGLTVVTAKKSGRQATCGGAWRADAFVRPRAFLSAKAGPARVAVECENPERAHLTPRSDHREKARSSR